MIRLQQDTGRSLRDALSSSVGPDAVVSALEFYASAWEQDVDAERTVNGWEGTIGSVEPSEDLRNDMGNRAREALSILSTNTSDDGLVELVARAIAASDRRFDNLTYHAVYVRRARAAIAAMPNSDRDAAQRRREAAEAEGQQPGPQGIAQKEI